MGERGRLELLFLGSGNAFADVARCYSGFLANERVMFDCPPTAAYGLKRAGIDPQQIDTIVLSHFHADHYFGLPFLFLEYRFPGLIHGLNPIRARDLTIVGPPGIADTVEQLAQLAFPNLLNHTDGYRRRYIEIGPGEEKEAGGLRLSAAKMNHAEGSLPLALGYRVELEGRRFAYTGDSAWCDTLYDIGRDVEVYVCDATYDQGRNLPEHLSLDECRELRAGLDARTTMILTHLGHRVAPRDMHRTFMADDLARFTFS